MKLSVSKSKLMESLNIVNEATPSKSSLDILEGIKIDVKTDSITLMSTDLQLSCVSVIRSGITVHEQGSVVINAKFISDIIKNMPGTEINMATGEGNKLVITSKDTKYEILSYNPDIYPALDAFDGEYVAGVNIKNKTLISLIEKTIYAASKSSTTHITNSVLFSLESGKATMVALDGFRLALCSEQVETQEDVKAVIPRDNLVKIYKILKLRDSEFDVGITVYQNWLEYTIGNDSVKTRLAEGSFIDYKNVIPARDSILHETSVKKDDLLSAIKRVDLLRKVDGQDVITVNFNFGGNLLTIEGDTGKATYQDIITCTPMDEYDASYNVRYIEEAVTAIESDNIKMSFATLQGTMLLTTDADNSQQHLVLPVVKGRKS